MMSELQLSSSLIIISYFAISIVVVDALFKKNKNVGFTYALTGLILTSIASIITLIDSPGYISPSNTSNLISKGMITFGGYSSFFDLLFCIGGILVLLASRDYLKREYRELTEYYSLIIFSIIGMMLIVHANNMLVLFVGIELMSISFYILAGFIRTYGKSVEASLKYFLLGSFATGFLVYGIALIYGATGSFDITTITENIKDGVNSPILLSIGTGLILVGLFFKTAIFPFHQWAPDVYHGSPTTVTAFMSTTGKAAALIALYIVARPLLPIPNPDDIISNYNTIIYIIAIASALTMIVGNISALIQKNVKRMLAYSSVAHAGYMLMGIVANSQLGWTGIAFYAVAYLFMQIGAFIIVGIIEKNKEQNLNLDDYAGLSKSSPFIAALMSLFMLSLAGIPPMAGFFGKYYLFAAAIESGFTWLTIIAVIASIISMYYYIGLIVQMYFKEQSGELIKPKPGLANITLICCGLATLLFGVYPSLIVNITEKCFKILG